ncbi:hypothetical protein [Rhizobium sp. 2MFCol3.1]|uniref:hypothetical protein n=1 Tax=Rhizobium sp. 2MFCol3.1 TaxID=1246459 RepID=UPI00036E78A3|nr:hypothetical protein [Rhizobium sp. 2MFCol3.1]
MTIYLIYFLAIIGIIAICFFAFEQFRLWKHRKIVWGESSEEERRKWASGARHYEIHAHAPIFGFYLTTDYLYTRPTLARLDVTNMQSVVTRVSGYQAAIETLNRARNEFGDKAAEVVEVRAISDKSPEIDLAFFFANATDAMMFKLANS